MLTGNIGAQRIRLDAVEQMQFEGMDVRNEILGLTGVSPELTSVCIDSVVCVKTLYNDMISILLANHG
jgi:hypothetical protein